MLIGRVAVPGGSTSDSVNVAVGGGMLFGLAEKKLWLAQLGEGNCTKEDGE